MRMHSGLFLCPILSLDPANRNEGAAGVFPRNTYNPASLLSLDNDRRLKPLTQYCARGLALCTKPKVRTATLKLCPPS